MNFPADPLDPPVDVHIHYLRLPDQTERFVQQLVHDGTRLKVTLARGMAFERPLRIGGCVALETGSDVVWFTFPGAWHDIGRFHRADGTFSGIYANILTPCTFDTRHDWHTTDLFLDLWLPAGDRESSTGSVAEFQLLDEDELAHAQEVGSIPPHLADLARHEAAHLLASAQTGDWPPEPVWDWTRERALYSART